MVITKTLYKYMPISSEQSEKVVVQNIKAYVLNLLLVNYDMQIENKAVQFVYNVLLQIKTILERTFVK